MIMTITDFKEVHKNCKLKWHVETDSIRDLIRVTCITHDEFILGYKPEPFCHDPINCIGNGYCKKDPACNN